MKVHHINDGSADWLVRGTTDPEKALEAILDEYPDEATEHVPEADEVDLALYPRVERAGWFRINPCPSGGDYGWLLGYASGPGRGNFEGVYLDVGWEVEVFEGDEPVASELVGP